VLGSVGSHWPIRAAIRGPSFQLHSQFHASRISFSPSPLPPSLLPAALFARTNCDLLSLVPVCSSRLRLLPARGLGFGIPQQLHTPPSRAIASRQDGCHSRGFRHLSLRSSVCLSISHFGPNRCVQCGESCHKRVCPKRRRKPDGK
jgi:hypothetical protein